MLLVFSERKLCHDRICGSLVELSRPPATLSNLVVLGFDGIQITIA
jgi:hypothetical protein